MPSPPVFSTSTTPLRKSRGSAFFTMSSHSSAGRQTGMVGWWSSGGGGTLIALANEQQAARICHRHGFLRHDSTHRR